MSIIIDTPDGIAFFRALSRQGAAKLGRPGIVKVLRTVYGYPGSPAAVKAMHDEYIEGTLTIRGWSSERSERAQSIAQEALTRAEEEHENDPNLKVYADSNVQALYDAGAITSDEGDDACLLLFVEVIRQKAGSR